jgi:hypothetical protein
LSWSNPLEDLMNPLEQDFWAELAQI